MNDTLKTAVMVSKLGVLFTDNLTDNLAWRKRMLSAAGVTFPDDWDELPEEEKKRRLALCESVQTTNNNNK